MKSMLIIGMGKFGHHLCRDLLQFDNEIMIVDKKESAIDDLAAEVTTALVADCTREDVLRNLGVENFDICFVCIGDNFQNNLEITSLLKDLGAKYVISKSNSDIHTKFLLRNGADEVVHPDKHIAERVAVRHSNDSIFDYIELEDGYCIYEITPPKEWVGKSLKESNIRAKYNVGIIGIKKENEKTRVIPSANHVISAEERIITIAHEDDIKKLLKKLL